MENTNQRKKRLFVDGDLSDEGQNASKNSRAAYYNRNQFLTNPHRQQLFGGKVLSNVLEEALTGNLLSFLCVLKKVSVSEPFL